MLSCAQLEKSEMCLPTCKLVSVSWANQGNPGAAGEPLCELPYAVLGRKQPWAVASNPREDNVGNGI